MNQHTRAVFICLLAAVSSSFAAHCPTDTNQTKIEHPKTTEPSSVYSKYFWLLPPLKPTFQTDGPEMLSMFRGQAPTMPLPAAPQGRPEKKD